jgi:hypothetical protein
MGNEDNFDREDWHNETLTQLEYYESEYQKLKEMTSFLTKTTTTLTVMMRTKSTVLRTLTMKWRVGDSEDDDNDIFGGYRYI